MGKKTKKIRAFQTPVAASSTTGKNDSQGPFSGSWKHIFIIVILCIAAYLNTLSTDFVWDDIYQIKNNDQIKSLLNIPSFFSSNVWAGVRGFSSYYYRPLFILSLAVDHSVWGEQPFGYHLTNMVLHILMSIMVYLFALKFLKSATGSLFSAAVYAVYPVHAEAVAWISGRNEILSALFLLSSFYFYIFYREKRRIAYIISSLVLFSFSLLSKETAVVLPVIILLYELFFGNRDWKETTRVPALYGLLIIPYFIVRLILFKSMTGAQSQPLLWRLSTTPGLIMEYLRLLISPINLKVFYDIAVKKTFLSQDVIIPIFVLGIICLGIIFSLRYDKRIFFNLLFTLITLVPVSGIVVLIAPALMADRYLYLPSAGFSMALGTIFSIIPGSVVKKSSRQETKGIPGLTWTAHTGVKLAGALIVCLLLVLNIQRNNAWKDNFTFKSIMVRDAPGSFFSHYSLGLYYDDQGTLDEAVRELKFAAQLNPDHAETHNSLGIVYDRQGRLNEAMNEYLIALRLNPNNAKTHDNLGILYEKESKFDEALREYRTAVRLDPANVNAYANLGLILRKLNRPIDSAESLLAAIKLNKNDPVLHNNLGVVYFGQQRFDDAAKEFQIALALNPDYVEAHNNLGLAFRKVNRLAEAAEQLRTALRLNPNYAEAYNNLGVVYVIQGKIADAVVQFNKAVGLNPQNEAFILNLKKASGQQGKGL